MNRGTREPDQELMASDLEIALHQVLRRRNFKGAGHIRVSLSRETSAPTCLVELDLDAAQALAKALRK